MSTRDASNPEVIRIGICYCSSHFHGQFGGKKFHVGQRSFVFNEVFVSRNLRRSLLFNRCHFFIDHHQNGGGWHTIELSRNDLIPNQFGNRWGLKIGGLSLDAWERYSCHDWTLRRPVSPDSIVEQVKKFITIMDQEQRLDKWLANMTPNGWDLPISIGTVGCRFRLRIGVCTCTEQYHQTLQGTDIPIRRLDYTQFAEPIRASVEVVSISEKSHFSDISEKRPHFFIDVHPRRLKRFFTSLSMVHFVGRKTRPTIVYVGSGPFRRRSRCWLQKQPPGELEIANSIQSILEQVTPSQFITWLSQLTPAQN